MTKTAKRAKAAASRKKTGIVKAVKALLKKVNPSARISGASVVKLKGGALKITPLKANPGGGQYTVVSAGGRWGAFSTKKRAEEYAKRMREANRQAGNRSPVRVVKVK